MGNPGSRSDVAEGGEEKEVVEETLDGGRQGASGGRLAIGVIGMIVGLGLTVFGAAERGAGMWISGIAVFCIFAGVAAGASRIGLNIPGKAFFGAIFPTRKRVKTTTKTKGELSGFPKDGKRPSRGPKP